MSHTHPPVEEPVVPVQETEASVPHAVLTCEECCAQVPGDEAITEEGTEYVMYFCGIDCYDTWHRRCGEDLQLDHHKE